MSDSAIVDAGETAPDFELRGTDNGEERLYRLSEYTDDRQWVFVSFYSFDFNPICTEGMCALRDAEFFDIYDDLCVLGISGDGLHAHERFAEEHNINYPLLADTGKDVGAQYGVIKDQQNGLRQVHNRAAFIIDETRTIRFATLVDADSPDDIDLEPINDVIKELRA